MRLLHLAEQERRERIAGLAEVVAAGVVAARAEAIEVELPPPVLVAHPRDGNVWWRYSNPP